jgi:glycosyltransferase involved in cell wall biosynthesis
MACGAALVSTDNGGVRAYADNEKTALLSPPKDPGALAANILRLLENRDLRLQLASAGHQRMQQFTWDRAVTHFESVLQNALIETSSVVKGTAKSSCGKFYAG